MKLSLLAVLTLFTCSIFAGSQASKEKSLHWGINLEPSAYFELAAERFKRNVETRTNNTVKVHIHVKDHTQVERDHLMDVKKNKYQMGQEVVNILAKREPVFGLWELPFLFEDDDQVFAYMESPYAMDSLKSLTKYNVTAVGYTYSGGFMYTVGDKMDNMLELKGKDLYVDHSTPAYSELMDTKYKLNNVVDNAEKNINNPNGSSELLSSFLEQLYTSKPKGKKTYLNLTKHRVIARTIFLNNDFLNSLTENEKRVVLEEAKKAAEFERKLSYEASNNHLDNIRNNRKDIVINSWSLKKRIEHRQDFASEYQSYEKKYGEGIIEDIINLKNAPVREYASHN
jgi:C4-dicarboxylate-binding protein DctP